MDLNTYANGLIERVCDDMGIKPVQLLSRSRRQDLVNGRQMVCAILHDVCGVEYGQIAPIIQRDRATVNHAVRSHAERMEAKDYINGLYQKQYRKLLEREKPTAPKWGEKRTKRTYVHFYHPAIGPRVRDFASEKRVSITEAAVYLIRRGFEALEK